MRMKRKGEKGEKSGLNGIAQSSNFNLGLEAKLADLDSSDLAKVHNKGLAMMQVQVQLQIQPKVLTPSINHSQKIVISLSNLSKHHFLLPPLKTTIFNCI